MAPRTRAQLLADFADNTTGNVTEARLRALVDSLILAAEPSIDLVAAMFSSGQNKITASSAYPDTPPINAFVAGVANNAGFLTNGVNTGWMKIEFPSAVIAKSYCITAWSSDTFPARAPKTWTLQGSNDDAAWTVLDTQTNYTTWTRWGRSAFAIAAPAAYKFYKLDVTLNGGDGYMGVGRIWLYGQPSF